ncbi:hypothetical protein K2X05_13545 [bacterium]|nr:hypothetical protein [bacterium]
MLKNMAREDMSETSVTYSFHRRLATGLEYDRLQIGKTDTSWGLVELNGLLKRWNGEDSQANVYVLTGVGAYWDNQREDSFASKWGVQADYETRQFYTLAQFVSWHSDQIDSNYALYRLGFAPFTAGHNELNIWCIAQFDYNKDMRNEVQITPFLRFYFKNVLWEVGSSLRGNFYGQFMVHL